ncbi:MAG: rhodanese-like domain-containing protein [Rhodospirillales bacterium]|nr:rhodanese-like domain-containing protein [Rhodospirillales bacterium]MCW8862683.1 rhodanese-like domain-containing protein [Rhodospirillales bacterium]MCW9002342.1 rhodanese-like domain-containing protein [Rhodospirillales bacterium]MCW9040808.1 rhodanese-like domain-containing protein [Rhodospirillales bacterium]
MELELEKIWPIVVAVAAVLAIRMIPRMLSKATIVETDELKKRMDAGSDVVILDVRTPMEFKGGYIPGSVNLPLGEIRGRLNEIGSDLAGLVDEPVFLVCRSDNRSLSAAGTLHKAGFKNLFVVKGGVSRWRRAGLPISGAS